MLKLVSLLFKVRRLIALLCQEPIHPPPVRDFLSCASLVWWKFSRWCFASRFSYLPLRVFPRLNKQFLSQILEVAPWSNFRASFQVFHLNRWPPSSSPVFWFTFASIYNANCSWHHPEGVFCCLFQYTEASFESYSPPISEIRNEYILDSRNQVENLVKALNRVSEVRWASCLTTTQENIYQE